LRAEYKGLEAAVVPKERLPALHVGLQQLCTLPEGTVKATAVSASEYFVFAICQLDILSVNEVPGRTRALK
jgi:hypothetical protein